MCLPGGALTNPLPPVRIPETPPGTTFPTCHTRAGFSLANETLPKHLFGNAPFSLGFTSRNAQRHFVRSRTPTCGARPGNHLGRIERRQLAAALEDAAVDHDR